MRAPVEGAYAPGRPALEAHPRLRVGLQGRWSASGPSVALPRSFPFVRVSNHGGVTQSASGSTIAKSRPAARLRAHRDRAAVGLRDRGDDREAEADAAAGARARAVGAVEALEDALELARRACPGLRRRPRSRPMPSARCTRTRAGVPGGVCERTLPSRLSSTCRRRVAVAEDDRRLGVELDRTGRVDASARSRPPRLRARRARRGSRSSGCPSSRRASRSRSSTSALIRSLSRLIPVIARARSSGRLSAPRSNSSA